MTLSESNKQRVERRLKKIQGTNQNTWQIQWVIFTCTALKVRSLRRGKGESSCRVKTIKADCRSNMKVS
jgi:hypothetical protein